MDCPDCERIDDQIFPKTTFWMSLPSKDSFSKLAVWLGSNGYEGEQFNSQGIRLTLSESRVEAFITALYGEINGQELAQSRIVTTEGAPPGPTDLRRVMMGDVFVNRFMARWIVDAIRDQSYESWYQPIVAADSGEVYAHEALFRMRDKTGQVINPGQVFKRAEQAGLLFTLDLTARKAAVEGAARAGLETKLFINFNPSSIYDPSYCLRTTASAIEELGLKPENIVFELTETHQARDKAHLKGILAFYRASGFGVALDDIGSGYSGLSLLHEMKPDIAKIDMDLVRGIHRDASKQTIVDSILRIAQKNGICSVAEGIETAEEAEWLKTAGADYLQGYYFGKPQPLSVAEAAE